LRILGIDFGDRKIGLAVSDRLGITAQGIQGYRLENTKADAAFFRRLVREYGIEEIVVGLPLRMDGTPGTRVEKTRAFGRWLEKTLGLPVRFWDERLTTRQANRILSQQKRSPRSRKALEDRISAVIILSAYLESRRGGPGADQDS